MKTKIKLLRNDQVWHPSRGGRPYNRNALKTGMHTVQFRARKARFRHLRARVGTAAFTNRPEEGSQLVTE